MDEIKEMQVQAMVAFMLHLKELKVNMQDLNILGMVNIASEWADIVNNNTTPEKIAENLANGYANLKKLDIDDTTDFDLTKN